MKKRGKKRENPSTTTTGSSTDASSTCGRSPTIWCDEKLRRNGWAGDFVSLPHKLTIELDEIRDFLQTFLVWNGWLHWHHGGKSQQCFLYIHEETRSIFVAMMHYKGGETTPISR